MAAYGPSGDRRILPVMQFQLRKIGHVVLNVTDLERAVAFYTGVLGLAVSEMVGSANWSWGMYPGLSHGAMNTLSAHGTDEQKHTYLTKLVSGEWTGTMCLTEPH